MAIRQSPILRVCLLVALAAALADAASLRGAKEIEEAVSTDEKETSEDFYQMIIDEPFEEEAEDKEPSLYEKYVEPLFTTHEAPEEGERDLQQFLFRGAAGPVPVDGFGNFGTTQNFANPRAGLGTNGFFFNFNGRQPVVRPQRPQPAVRPVVPPVINNNFGRSWLLNPNSSLRPPAQRVQYLPANNRGVYAGGYGALLPARTNYAAQPFAYQAILGRQPVPAFAGGGGGGAEGFGGYRGGYGGYWNDGGIISF